MSNNYLYKAACSVVFVEFHSQKEHQEQKEFVPVVESGDLKQLARTYEYSCHHTLGNVILSGVIMEDDPGKGFRPTYRPSGSCRSEKTAADLES